MPKQFKHDTHKFTSNSYHTKITTAKIVEFHAIAVAKTPKCTGRNEISSFTQLQHHQSHSHTNSLSHTISAQNSGGRDASNQPTTKFCIYNTKNPNSVSYCYISSSIDMANIKSTSATRMDRSATQNFHLSRSPKASKTSSK